MSHSNFEISRSKDLLLVEDNLDIREIITEEMTYRGWGVHSALDADIIDVMVRGCSLVLLDWHLPGYDKDAIRKACSIRPMIVMSGEFDVDDPNVLMKPFTMEQLESRLDAELARAKKMILVGDVVTSVNTNESMKEAEVMSVHGAMVEVKDLDTGKIFQVRMEHLRPTAYS